MTARPGKGLPDGGSFGAAAKEEGAQGDGSAWSAGSSGPYPRQGSGYALLLQAIRADNKKIGMESGASCSSAGRDLAAQVRHAYALKK